VEPNVGIGVEMNAALEIRLFGPLAVYRNGVPIALPASRKVRGLLAYLTLAKNAVTRAHLCELLWEVPNDPRGELRWALSKVRGVVDEPECRRIEPAADLVRLDLRDCFVDVLKIARAAAGIELCAAEELQALSGLCRGDVLEGLEIEACPAFNGWLAAQRRLFRSHAIAILERLCGLVPETGVFPILDRWLQLAPFDERAHTRLLAALGRQHMIREGEEHLAATIRLFESEALDHSCIRAAWKPVRSAGIGASATAGAEPIAQNGRASIAVMPFADHSDIVQPHGGVARALAHDVITRLAKLRSLIVIAQGSVFALHERGIARAEAGRLLNVDYSAGGTVRRHGDRLTVTVELAETHSARIVWAERYAGRGGDPFDILDEIGDAIVAEIANEIEASERNRAILKAPNSLNAWEAHHRGLWHMYRFTKADNDLAQHFFELAVRLDPTFSRAHAGLSFAHFQNAFQGWKARKAEVERALAAAGGSVMADDRDPAAHWALGRALWLRSEFDTCVSELERSVQLSPNFAQAHYTLAFVRSQVGDPGKAIEAADTSRRLSPFDPMLFGFLGARSMALIRLGRFDEAADWGARAAARPNAHEHVVAIAAFAMALAGRLEEARGYLETIRRTIPGYHVENFLAAMQFAPEDERLYRDAAKHIPRR
jgi:DNA-binding SARP family transcriptional activator